MFISLEVEKSNMKALILLPVLLLFVAIVSGCVQQPPATGSQGDTVTIKDFAFTPQVLTVKAGTTVTWTNEDSASHTITSAGFFDSGTIATGQTFSKTFDQPGTYNYACSIHPSMKGKIIVEQ